MGFGHYCELAVNFPQGQAQLQGEHRQERASFRAAVRELLQQVVGG